MDELDLGVCDANETTLNQCRKHERLRQKGKVSLGMPHLTTLSTLLWQYLVHWFLYLYVYILDGKQDEQYRCPGLNDRETNSSVNYTLRELQSL